MTDTDRTWLITGCSSGFGRELTLELIERGERVVATARRRETIEDLAARSPDTVLAVALDVTRPDSVEAAVAAAERRFGGVDVLVNNAGFVVIGGVEEVPEAMIRDIMETNFFGMLTTTRAVLPGMRARRRGWILNISSMGGISGGLGMGYYAATKFAMAGISESLRQEVAPLGIKVVVIEPGGHRTNAVTSASVSPVEIDDYAETVGRHRAFMRVHATELAGDPRLAARAMVAVVDADDPPVHLPLGHDALARLDRKIESLVRDRDRWRELTLSTGAPA